MSLIGLKCNEIIFINYGVWLPQVLLFTCDLMMAW